MRPLALVLLALLLSSCSDPVRLREDYLGKSIFQPGKVPDAVEHDAYGRALPPDRPPVPPAGGDPGLLSRIPDPFAAIGALFD